MNEKYSEKRVSTIMMADVAGYSRMVAQDVESTVETLKNYQGVFAKIVGTQGGRIVNAPGDSILAEFADPVAAVKGAKEIQEELERRNRALSADRRMRFRIGISRGEVLVADEAIYGNEVNIAARLETLADPGGICISSKAHANVNGILELNFEFLGEHQLKNIENPVPVYRMIFGSGAKQLDRFHHIAARLSRPSVAVLPFANFSGDKEQEYFADGITEDIITELSRFKSLLVIARNSTFVYKGQAIPIRQVGKELGVAYVLEGSVRKSGNRVRITAQLIDSVDGSHLWAERYDRDMEDIFSIQDDVAQMIVANIPRRLESASLDRVKNTTPGNLAAYDLLLRAKDYHFRGTPEDNAQAIEVLDKAIDMDPDFAQAFAWKACTLGQAYARGYKEGTRELIEEMMGLAEKSRELDDDDSEGHRILCEIHLLQHRYDQSELHHERAMALNPNDPRIVAQRGQLYTWTGRAAEGAAWLELSRRLDPYPPDRRADSLGLAQFVARRYEDAVRAYQMIGAPTRNHHASLSASLAMLDRTDEAREHADAVLAMDPKFSAESFVKAQHYRDEPDREHHRQALLRAGLP